MPTCLWEYLWNQPKPMFLLHENQLLFIFFPRKMLSSRSSSIPNVSSRWSHAFVETLQRGEAVGGRTWSLDRAFWASEVVEKCLGQCFWVVKWGPSLGTKRRMSMDQRRMKTNKKRSSAKWWKMNLSLQHWSQEGLEDSFSFGVWAHVSSADLPGVESF